MHERYFSIEQKNTGKSPQKCCSCIDEGMNKLTEEKAKYTRARVFTQLALSADST